MDWFKNVQEFWDHIPGCKDPSEEASVFRVQVCTVVHMRGHIRPILGGIS